MDFAKLVDLSKWNGPCFPVGHPQAGAPDLSKPMAFDITKFKAQGGVGVIARLGSIDNVTGECYQDGRLPEIVAWCEANDIPLGYYFYMRPKFSGALQGNFIKNTLRDLPWHLDVWLDVEQAGQYPDQSADSVEAAADELLEIDPERVGIYSSKYFWHDVIKMPERPLWPALKFWPARWNTSLASPWSDGNAIMRDWDTWLMWQYWADGNQQAASWGFTTGTVNLDLNYFNGTVEDFNKYYGLVVPDPLEARIAALESLLAEHTTAHNLYVRYNEDRAKVLQDQAKALQDQVNNLETKLHRLANWASGYQV